MVATAAQIAANRANARRSTGPRSPEGKAASSHNALSHGAYASDDTILATAPSAYLDDFRAHFQPAGVLEEHLVAHLAVLASRRDRLAAALDALLELNERHAFTEHLHERYGINVDNAYIDGQPSWLAAMRRYDGNTYVDDRFPEPVSDPDLDPDPILCSLAYTLSGPRAAALFRHEASVDRRFSATLKELATLQDRRRAAALAAAAPPAPPFEPTLQRALDRYRRETAAPANPQRDPCPSATPPSPASGTATRTSDPLPAPPLYDTGPIPTPVADRQACLPDQSQSALPAPQLCLPPEQHEVGAASAQKEANAMVANRPRQRHAPRDRGRRFPIEPIPAAYLPDDDPGFLSVLPRDPEAPSSIPAHWPAALVPEQ
jgi:hypothetical protein